MSERSLDPGDGLLAPAFLARLAQLQLLSRRLAEARRRGRRQTRRAGAGLEAIDAQVVDHATLAALRAGVEDEGEFLAARAVRVLRSGDKTAWLEVVLDEGRNRHIRRLLAAFDLQVLRLVRVAIGGLQLGDLGKGQWRVLQVSDQQRLGAAAPG